MGQSDLSGEAIEMRLTEDQNKDLKNEFERIDRNNDGFLQKNEVLFGLKKTLSNINEIRLKMMVDQIFEQYDTNRDGKLSWREFLKYKRPTLKLKKIEKKPSNK